MTTSLVLDFVEQHAGADQPWCCLVSVFEQHDPYVCEQWAYDLYDPNNIPVQKNITASFEGKPALYRKAADIFADMTDEHKRPAAASYYAMITEIDQHFDRLLDRLERTGQRSDTIIVLTKGHG